MFSCFVVPVMQRIIMSRAIYTYSTNSKTPSASRLGGLFFVLFLGYPKPIALSKHSWQQVSLESAA